MSYEFKGTPGPWVLGVKDKDMQIVEVDAPKGDGVNVSSWSGFVRCYGSFVDDYVFDQATANARAIAAVPELIGVLAGIVERWDSLAPEEEISEEHKQARTALAKATGADQ